VAARFEAVAAIRSDLSSRLSLVLADSDQELSFEEEAATGSLVVNLDRKPRVLAGIGRAFGAVVVLLGSPSRLPDTYVCSLDGLDASSWQTANKVLDNLLRNVKCPILTERRIGHILSPEWQLRLPVPDPWSQRGWKLKIRNRERNEPPHVTLMFKTTYWRWGIRELSFRDSSPPPGDVPDEIVSWLRNHNEFWVGVWNVAYPENPVD